MISEDFTKVVVGSQKESYMLKQPTDEYGAPTDEKDDEGRLVFEQTTIP